MLPMTQNGRQPIPDAPSMNARIQLAIVDQQLAVWQQEQYGAEVSIRVHRKIGGEGVQEAVKNLTKRMEECEKAQDELQIIRAELVSAIETGHDAPLN